MSSSDTQKHKKSRSDKSDPVHATLVSPEWSRPVSVEDLGLQQFSQTIEPTDLELKALIKRFGVDDLAGLTAQVSLQLLPNGDVLLEASYKARITQTCGVTMEPVVSGISDEFTMSYSDDVDASWGHDEEEFAVLDDDIELSEPIVDGKIDIAEAVSEQLALEIDPFPRVQGATFDGYSTGTKAGNEPVPEKKNPFAVLSKLKATPETSE